MPLQRDPAVLGGHGYLQGGNFAPPKSAIKRMWRKKLAADNGRLADLPSVPTGEPLVRWGMSRDACLDLLNCVTSS